MKFFFSSYHQHPDDPRNKQKISRDVYLTLLSSVASISSFLQGYTLTLSGILILNKLFLNEVSYENSSKFSDRFLYLFYFGSILGCVFSYIFADYFGRKYTLLFFTVVCIATLLWSSMSTSGANLLSTRFALGYIVGTLVATSAVFISEISTPLERGRSLAQMNVFQISGAVVCGIFYYSFYTEFETGWRLDISTPVVLLVFQVFILFVVPESPRWTLAHKTPSECLLSLRQLRRTNDVSREFSGIYKALSHDARLGDGWIDMWTHRSIRYRLRLCGLLQLTQHFVGLPAVTIYAGVMIQRVGVQWVDAGVALVYSSALAGSVFGYYKIDSWGRRSLLITGYVLLSATWLLAAGTVVLGRLDIGAFRPPSESNRNHTRYFNHTNTSITYAPSMRPIVMSLVPSQSVYQPTSLGPSTSAWLDPMMKRVTLIAVSGLSVNDIYGWFDSSSWDFHEYSGVFRYMFMVLLCVIAFVCASTLGAAMTAVSAELFPLRARMKSVGLSLSCNSISAFVSAYLMKYFLQECSTPAVNGPEQQQQLMSLMIAFAVVAIVVGLFVYLMLPETRGLMLEDMEELFDLNVVAQQQTTTQQTGASGSTGTGGINSSSTGGTVNSSSSGESTGLLTGSGSSALSLSNLWKCCNLRDCYTHTCYYCLCCCPAMSTKGLMGFRTVRHTAPGLAPSGSSNNTNIHSNVSSTNVTNALRNTDLTVNSDSGSSGGHFLSSNLNTQDEELYNPETLHKYSSEMRDSNFLFFTNENDNDESDLTSRSQVSSDFRSPNTFGLMLSEGFIGTSESEPLINTRWNTNGGGTSPMRYIPIVAASVIAGFGTSAAAPVNSGYGSVQTKGRGVRRISLSPMSLLPDV